jgi:cytoskeleton protein RodZ
MSQGSSPDFERSGPDGDISLGRELRRAREVRGISVQQIAQETKINERYIHALENDRLDLLPGQPYTSNFVRSIARCIGADEEELIDYLNYHLRVMQPERHDSHRAHSAPRGRQGMPLVLGLGAILVIVALPVALRDGDKPDTRPGGREPRASVPSGATPATAAGTSAPLASSAPAPASALPGASGPAPSGAVAASAPRVAPPILAAMSAPAPSAPEATGPSAPAGASAAGASGAVSEPAPTVRLVWRSRAWVDTYQEGDDSPRVGMKSEGDEMTWTLDRPLTLKIGNAGKVDMYIDGQLARPLGAEDETRRLSLDRKNWKSFLR